MVIENNEYFSELNEWYDDILIYNIVGFLHIYGRMSFKKIKENINDPNGDPIQKLKDMSKKLIIKNHIGAICELDILKYKKRGRTAAGRKQHIKTVLFLFNVAYATELGIRLDFDNFFKNGEDNFQIEHINAIGYNDKTDETDEIDGINGKEKDFILNLSLLDKETNQDLSFHSFSIKQEILKRDEYARRLLPCTNAVFKKCFSKDSSNIDFWSKEDGCAYIEKMKSTLKNFLN